MHLAARGRFLVSCKRLLESGASVHIMDEAGLSPIGYALQSGSNTSEIESIAHLLIDAGANASITYNNVEVVLF